VLEGDMVTQSSNIDYRVLRDRYDGLYMANHGYDKIRANTSISNGDSDLIAFGVPFLANPDLVSRYQRNLPLNNADPDTFYGGTEQGYTDYPIFEQMGTAPA